MQHLYRNNFRIVLSSLILLVITVLVSSYLVNFKSVKTKADDQSVFVTATTASGITFSVTNGDSVPFGTVIPGNPQSSPVGGTVLSVTTNAANGYTIGVSDGKTGGNSCLVSSGNYIADYTGTIGTPTTWSGTGLGVTLFAADTTKEAKWGTGSAYDDSNNKYAGIPQNSTIAHTVTGYRATPDTSSWAFKIEIPQAQAIGTYTGSVTFTATAVLS